MGMTQTPDCVNRGMQVTNCATQRTSVLAAGDDATRFCNNCKTQLNDFFQASGGDTAGLQRGKQLLQ